MPHLLRCISIKILKMNSVLSTMDLSKESISNNFNRKSISREIGHLES